MTDKTCDYCGAVGQMPTFMDDETMCYECIKVLPMDAREARKMVHDLRIELAKLKQKKVKTNGVFHCDKHGGYGFVSDCVECSRNT